MQSITCTNEALKILKIQTKNHNEGVTIRSEIKGSDVHIIYVFVLKKEAVDFNEIQLGTVVFETFPDHKFSKSGGAVACIFSAYDFLKSSLCISVGKGARLKRSEIQLSKI